MSGHGGGWANPARRFACSAIACFTFYAVLGGHVEHSCTPLLGMWLIGGALVQYTVAIIELQEGATTGGNVFLFFSAFFMLVGGLKFVFGYVAAANGWPAMDARIDGYAWFAMWLALWLWTPAYFKSPIVMTMVVLFLDIAVPIVALQDLALIGHDYAWLAADTLGLAGLFGIWMASAIILNTEFGRVIIPVGSPIIKPKNIAA